MKKSLEMLGEAEVTACVMAAAGVALILMVGHAIWKTAADKSFRSKRNFEDEQTKEIIT